MSESVLVINTPENCMECPLLTDSDECIMQDKEENRKAGSYTKLKEGCPLREIPDRKAVIGIDGASGIRERILHANRAGWNACIDMILERCKDETD